MKVNILSCINRFEFVAVEETMNNNAIMLQSSVGFCLFVFCFFLVLLFLFLFCCKSRWLLWAM